MHLPANPGMTIDLIEWTDPKSPTGRFPIHHVPSAHFCFNVKDLEGTYESLSQKGLSSYLRRAAAGRRRLGCRVLLRPGRQFIGAERATTEE